jgi:hypothetical protein
MTDLAVTAALKIASEQHDDWLARIGTSGVDEVNPEPHPWAGLGAPASDVAQVMYHGITEREWWKRKMLDCGITSFMQLPFEKGRELADSWLAIAPFETASERMRTVHQLRRAEGLGLVVRYRPKTDRGGDVGLTYWQIREEIAQ